MALCIVLLVMYGGFHISFRTKNPIFFYQISWDCPLKDGERDAAEARSRADETGGDDLLAEADSLEYLRPLVGLQGGDAHLSHHLNRNKRELQAVSRIRDPVPFF